MKQARNPQRHPDPMSTSTCNWWTACADYVFNSQQGIVKCRPSKTSFQPMLICTEWQEEEESPKIVQTNKQKSYWTYNQHLVFMHKFCLLWLASIHYRYTVGLVTSYYPNNHLSSCVSFCLTDYRDTECLITPYLPNNGESTWISFGLIWLTNICYRELSK
jgi:hypothetical protein